MKCTLPGKAQIPSAVVPVDKLHGDGEDQQELSGLAPSLWEKEPDVAILERGSAVNEHQENCRLRESTDPQCCCASG